MVLRSIEAMLKLAVPVFFGLSLIASSASGETDAVLGRAVRPNLRTRVRPFKTTLHWNEVDFQEEFLPSETAIVICDMGDSHWCTGLRAAGAGGL